MVTFCLFSDSCMNIRNHAPVKESLSALVHILSAFQVEESGLREILFSCSVSSHWFYFTLFVACSCTIFPYAWLWTDLTEGNAGWWPAYLLTGLCLYSWLWTSWHRCCNSRRSHKEEAYFNKLICYKKWRRHAWCASLPKLALKPHVCAWNSEPSVSACQLTH